MENQNKDREWYTNYMKSKVDKKEAYDLLCDKFWNVFINEGYNDLVLDSLMYKFKTLLLSKEEDVWKHVSAKSYYMWKNKSEDC